MWAGPAVSGWAQALTVSPPALDFGVTYEDAPQSQVVTVTNSGSEAVSVSGYWAYAVYGQVPFSASPAQFTLLPGASEAVTITFAPRHNIAHVTELIWQTDDRRGDAFLSLRGQGRYRLPYYAGTENTHEQVLKDSLKARLGRGYVSYSYNAARDEMFMLIDNQAVNGQGAPVNTLEGVYTGYTVTGYLNRTAAQNQGINTEHTFPQGFFNQALPMRSDLYHLFPTQIAANSERGNNPFGMVANPSWQVGGSKSGQGVFEPRDSHKGPVARAMLYFVLRYENYAGFLTGQEAILRQWHHSYPPDSVEQRRNTAIAAFQQNRNPLIDYPQLLDRIHSVSTLSQAPPTSGLFSPDTLIDFGTVATGTPHVYTLVITNTGNAPLALRNLSLSDPHLTFAGNSGADTLLAPGRARALRLQLDAATPGPLQATLRVETDAPSLPARTWPVTALLTGPDGLTSTWVARWRLAPQPARDQVQLLSTQWPAGVLTATLYDSAGRRVRQATLSTQAYTFPLPSLPPGTYWLHLRHGSQAGLLPLQITP